MSAAPDIGSLLAQLGGGGDPGAGAPPPDQAPQGGGEQPVEQLRKLVSDLQAYINAEPDEEDKLEGTKALQIIQKLLAKDQQDRDQAMGGSSQRILRKAGAGA